MFNRATRTGAGAATGETHRIARTGTDAAEGGMD